MQNWPNFGFHYGSSGGGAFNASLSEVAAAIASQSGVGTGGAITVSVTEARNTGVAPLSVFFDASATTASTLTSLPFHDLYYVWDFGDGSAGTWSFGARSGMDKNTATGPVTSHVYETAGSYTATCTVYHYSSGGTLSTASTTKSITVTAADTYYSGTNTICFSTSGTFTGAPSGSTQVTLSDFATAINTYQATGKRLLFRAGETFTGTTEANPNVTGPCTIGKFGTGAAPKFTSTSGTAFFYLSTRDTPTIKDWRIMDIELDGQDGAVFGFETRGGIDQVTLLRMNIHNVDNGVITSLDLLDFLNGAGFGGHHCWDQMAIVDSTIFTIHNSVPASGFYGMFLCGERCSVMGNTVDINYGGEHSIRNPYLGKAVLSNNYIAKNCPAKNSWTLRAPLFVGSLVIPAGTYTNKVVASENTFYNTASDWTVAIAPTSMTADERLQDIIVERNYLMNGTSVQNALITRGTVNNLTVRNNVINFTGATANACAFSADGSTSTGSPANTGFRAYNNTVYRSDSATTLSGFVFDVNANTYEIKNNLLYAPNATTTVLYTGAIDSGLVFGVNSTDSQIKNTNPLFSTIPTTATQLSSTDFKITTGSYGIDSGTWVTNFNDFLRVSRTGTYDLGAVQP